MKKCTLIIAWLFTLATNAQNIGIGKTTPIAKLDVKGNIAVNDSSLLLRSGNDLNNYLAYSVVVDGPRLNGYAGGVLSTNSTNALYWNYLGKIGIGISNPISSFANTANNIGASDGIGVGDKSLTWVNNAQGYTQALYNQGTIPGSSGLAIKIAETGPYSCLLDLSTGATSSGSGNRVMAVYGNGRISMGSGYPRQTLDVQGNIILRDSLGIGVAYPHAPIQLPNVSGRKIILYEDANNNSQYYGLAIDPATLHFQSTADHAFFTGIYGTSPVELLRIKANGNVSIGANTYDEKLTVNGAVKISDGGYTGLVNNAVSPVPAGGAGTMVFSAGHFFGWNGSQWKQLDN